MIKNINGVETVLNPARITGVLPGVNPTDVVTMQQLSRQDSGYIPYTGAVDDVNLGVYVLTTQRQVINADQAGATFPLIIDGGAASNGFLRIKGTNISTVNFFNSTTSVQWYVQNQTIAGSTLDFFSIGGSSNPDLGTFLIKPSTLEGFVRTSLKIGDLTAPTAKLHIAAGSATAGTAPIKLTTGTLTTAAVAGQIEYNNTFHVTNSDSTRRHVMTAASATKTVAGAPYANDGYITINIGGTDVKVMTTA